MLPCLSILHFSGTASHAWLAHYHQRNIAEHCCLCFYLVQGQPCHWNQHRWCLYVAFGPVCGAGVGPCYCVLWWRVPSHHTALLGLSRAHGIPLGADPARFCSVVARAGPETQKAAGGELEWFALSLVRTHAEHRGQLWPGFLGRLGWSRVFHANRHFLCVTFNLATQRISSRLLKINIFVQIRDHYIRTCITLHNAYFIHYWVLGSFYGINNWIITVSLNCPLGHI